MAIDKVTSQANLNKYLEESHIDPQTGKKLRLVVEKNERGEQCLIWRKLTWCEQISRSLFGWYSLHSAMAFTFKNNIVGTADQQAMRNRIFSERIFSKITQYNQTARYPIQAHKLLQPAETPESAFLQALEAREPEKAALLLPAVSFRSNNEYKALELAAKAGYAGIVNQILKSLYLPANLFCPRSLHTQYLLFALTKAVESKQKEVVEVILKNHSANITHGYAQNITLYHEAAKHYDKEIFEMILNGTAKYTSFIRYHRNADGLTPFHVAASMGNSEAVQLLLKYNHPSERSAAGQTALHIAAYLGHTAVCQTLLRHPDCKPNCKNDDRKTALDLALRHQPNNRELIDLLKAHGGLKAKELPYTM